MPVYRLQPTAIPVYWYVDNAYRECHPVLKNDAVNQSSRLPLQYDRAAGAQIFDAVKLSILQMEFAPGALISEAEIAARFGASRTPVREAFMSLRAAGLVKTLPSRGNFVTKMSEEKIKEARFIRSAIEVANIEALCEAGISDQYSVELKQNLKEQAKVLKGGDGLDFQYLDDAFHLTLARATGYERVATLLEREKMLLDRLRVLSLVSRSHMKMLLDEHQQIYDAVCQKNRKLAVNEMKKHLSGILSTLSSVAAEHSEYFE